MAHIDINFEHTNPKLIDWFNEKIFQSIFNSVESKNPANRHGQTPFHWAAQKGYLDICQLIVDFVENKNPVNNLGWTPLHISAMYGQFDVCKLIVENVENKHPVDDFGQTPKDLVKNHMFEIIQLFDWIVMPFSIQYKN